MIVFYKQGNLPVLNILNKVNINSSVYFLSLLFLFVFFANKESISQEIIEVEYFINADPGFGNANQIDITPANNIQKQNFNIDISELGQGFHHLNIRAKDDTGLWSLTTVHSFYKDNIKELADIVKAEYFFNTDPGIGNGTEIPVSAEQNIEGVNFTADIIDLEIGFHDLYIRTKDENDLWSLTNVRSFYIDYFEETPADIVKAEYFINSDPGIGNGTEIPVSAEQNIEGVNFTADISDLEIGFHDLYIRTKDENDLWSLTNVRSFYIDYFEETPADIVKAEYFINSDPGIGNGTEIPVSAEQNIEGVNFTADISDFETGFYDLYIRTKDENGKWSLTNVRSFYIETIDQDKPDIVEAEYFINEDP